MLPYETVLLQLNSFGCLQLGGKVIFLPTVSNEKFTAKSRQTLKNYEGSIPVRHYLSDFPTLIFMTFLH